MKHKCEHCKAEWDLHECPECGKFQLTIDDGLSAMKEFLREAEWKYPTEVGDTPELLKLINQLQVFVPPPEPDTHEYYRKLKSLEALVQDYESVSSPEDIDLAADDEEDEDDKEQAREYYIATEVSDACDNMKKGLEKTIVYLDSCIHNEVMRMFEPTTKTADDDT